MLIIPTNNERNKMNVCFEYDNIKLSQSISGKIFKVTYGTQMDTTRSYADACVLLGQAILHNAACNNLLDNENCED